MCGAGEADYASRAELCREREPKKESAMQTIETDFGRLEANPADLMLGELLVTDEGAEVEVVGLDPLRFELAPEEAEDWGE